MARIRTIKPDFWKNEELSELPPEVHLLAAALLNYADDEGYFRANPKLVKAECCPLREDSVSIHDALKQLHQIGYIRLFTGSDGKAYGHIRTFASNQKINRPSESKIKPLDEGTENSVNAHGVFSEPSPPEGNREGKGTGNEESSGERELDEREKAFKRFWDTYPRRKGTDPRKPAREKFKAALKAGHDAEEVIAGAQRFAELCEADGSVGTPYVPMARTWLYQERWRDAPDDGDESEEADAVSANEPPWRLRVNAWQKKGLWLPEQWGAPPGEPGCQVPAEAMPQNLQDHSEAGNA